MEPTTMSINNVDYVRKDSTSEKSESFKGMQCVIVRTDSAGVFYGYLDLEDERTSLKDKVAVIRKARRMWQWYGASLSECAQSGTPDISKCKFPEAVDSITLTEVIEIDDMTDKAKNSLDSVAIWKA